MSVECKWRLAQLRIPFGNARFVFSGKLGVSACKLLPRPPP